jgi:eukaryotic-like serine/threonine-protein kinase
VESRGIIGNYLLDRELGRGGMGIVYAATHRVLGRPAAIKLLLADSHRDDRIQRFFNEARAAMAIRHPGVVEVYDVGIANDGRPYLAMELLAGGTLTSRLARGPLPLRIAVDYARQIADALAAAHAVNIVHRDLKPDNVFVLDETNRIKLVDFGIAKLDTISVRTATGALIGTPAYMSPEQCEGVRDIDARSDLYSLGCVMFAMLTGAPPFTGEGAAGMIGNHLYTPPPPLRARCPTASEALEAVVQRLLAKSRDARFRDARELHAALSRPEVEILVGGSDAAMTADIPRALPTAASSPAEAPLKRTTTLPHAAPPPSRPPMDVPINAPTQATGISTQATGGPSTSPTSGPAPYAPPTAAPIGPSAPPAGWPQATPPPPQGHPPSAPPAASAPRSSRMPMLIVALLGCAASAVIAILLTKSCATTSTTIATRDDAAPVHTADLPADSAVVRTTADSWIDHDDLRRALLGEDAGVRDASTTIGTKKPPLDARVAERPRDAAVKVVVAEPPVDAPANLDPPEHVPPPPADIHLRIEFQPDAIEPIDRGAATAQIDQAARVMLDNRSLRLQITGHAENQEGGRTPTSLAEQRGKALKRQFVQRGVEANRIVVFTWIGAADGTHRAAIASLVRGSPRAEER